MCRNIGTLVFNFLASELNEGIMHTVSGYDVNYFLVFFIGAKTLLTLLRVIEKVSYLQSRALL